MKPVPQNICEPCWQGIHAHEQGKCQNTWTDSACDCRFEGATKSVIEKLESFADLEPNWDSYDGIPTKKEHIETAKNIINILTHFTEYPDPVPTSDGGVSLEWHEWHARGYVWVIGIDDEGISVFISDGINEYEIGE